MNDNCEEEQVVILLEGGCQLFSPAMEQLQEYCLSKELGEPSYMVMQLSDGFQSSVNFKEGLALSEMTSATEESAKELAAASALKQLKLERIVIKGNGTLAPNFV